MNTVGNWYAQNGTDWAAKAAQAFPKNSAHLKALRFACRLRSADFFMGAGCGGKTDSVSCGALSF